MTKSPCDKVPMTGFFYDIRFYVEGNKEVFKSGINFPEKQKHLHFSDVIDKY